MADTSHSKGPDRAHWTIEEERALLVFLIQHKAEAGDGFNFKKATWQAAANELINIPPRSGGPKSWSACKTKWQRLKETFAIVNTLSKQSGFSWDNDRGANIDEGSKGVWDAYVQKHPKAAPFRNKGWQHLDDVRAIMPTRAKGLHAFRASQAPANGTQLSTSDSSGVGGSGDDNESHPDLFIKGGSPDPPPSSPPASTDVSPPVSNATIQSAPPAVSLSSRPATKRKRPSVEDRSARPSVTSSGISPSEAFTSSSKWGRISGPVALNRIGEELASLNSIYRMSTEKKMKKAEEATLDISRQAEELLQDTEGSDLSFDAIIALTDFFMENDRHAQMYVGFKSADLRKFWARRKLQQMGFQVDDWDVMRSQEPT